MLGALRARVKARKQNTYQICPPPVFTFAKNRKVVAEQLEESLNTYLGQVEIDEKGTISPPFTDFLNSLRDDLCIKQQKMFPRHKLIVHGIIGTTGDNQPTISFATHTFMSLECGDDVVGLSVKNPVCYIAVMVAGFALD
ncbi:hypothetical protein CRM22_006311 [Opisthorchis felineus]|uniref:Uncharacterized protein n=1 Tax=Opisthorchis felineus TaxID=147828 RepID=A0A4S2LTW8_OPIFE|nr:hypothetical protein CRM22_006311 [Opisthorchis felineus]